MAHIFISYSKQDVEFMRYLKALLEAQGYSVWVDEARLSPSSRWWKTIEQNIETCSAFVMTFVYGIQTPIHAHGLLCERLTEEADGSMSTLLDTLTDRIDQAKVAVIELTRADPTVYLQLGYIWRSKIPKILLLKETESFYFDLPTDVIRYRKIRDVDTAISGTLDILKADGKI